MRRATRRTRASSSTPFTRHRRNNCRAARLVFLFALMIRSWASRLRRELSLRFLGEPGLIVGRQDLAGDRRGGLHHETTDLVPQLGEHARAIAFGSFARSDEHLFGGGGCLPRLLDLDSGGSGAGLLDQLLSLRVGL